MTGVRSESRQAEADLLVFHEIAHALTSSLDLDSILATIMRQIHRFFGPESSALLLTDEQQKELRYVIADGCFGTDLSARKIGYGEGLAGWVAEKGEPLMLSGHSGADLPGATLDSWLGFEVHSAVSIPLRSRLRTLGVIQLFNLPTEPLSDYALSFLRVLGDFAAIAIENSRAFERVQELTIIDECTGLYNLRHFDRTLNQEIMRSERLGLPMSLIFIDLDHFKLVNDHHGHQIGSRLLAEVGNAIRTHVRSIDLAFRYGGDEFLVLLPGTGKHRAVQVANRLLSALRKGPFFVTNNLQLSVTASLGVASYPEDGKTGQDILRTADARMYQVKGGSRDGIAFTGDGLLEKLA
jgi:diguanylate cyclase (GGDEF)-like protein